MKKHIAFLSALLLCLSTLFLLSSCGKHPIDAFLEKIKQENSAQITLTLYNVPNAGDSYTLVKKIDHTITYTTAGLENPEEYVETVGNKEYHYTKGSNNRWMMTEHFVKESDDSYSIEAMLKLFDSKNYEAVGGKRNTYRQKKGVVFDSFDDIVMTVGDDFLVIEGDVLSEGLHYRCKIIISDIGKISLTLPTLG